MEPNVSVSSKTFKTLEPQMQLFGNSITFVEIVHYYLEGVWLRSRPEIKKIKNSFHLSV